MGNFSQQALPLPNFKMPPPNMPPMEFFRKVLPPNILLQTHPMIPQQLQPNPLIRPPQQVPPPPLRSSQSQFLPPSQPTPPPPTLGFPLRYPFKPMLRLHHQHSFQTPTPTLFNSTFLRAPRLLFHHSRISFGLIHPLQTSTSRLLNKGIQP